MKKVLIISGHPNENSYNQALSKSYEEGLRHANVQLSRIDIRKLDFNLNLSHGFGSTPQEPDVAAAIKKLQQADHIVWFFPMWWYGYPALMKGFIDRTFLPGIAFKYQDKPFPVQLFKGKTASIVITADAPYWYNRWVMGNPAIKQLKKGTLQFCGIRTTKITYIAPIRKSTQDFREQWLAKCIKWGQMLNHRLLQWYAIFIRRKHIAHEIEEWTHLVEDIRNRLRKIRR